MTAMKANFKTLSSVLAAKLDQELMSTGGFSIDQLMELAGLSVAHAIYKQYPPQPKSRNQILMLVGPGNNGGDGLVASRHLKLWGYDPVIFYPKRSTRNELYHRLLVQLEKLNISQVESLDQVKILLAETGKISVIVDSLFGFSFKPPIRPPFGDLIDFLAENYRKIAPIVSVDIPSGWDVDEGPIDKDISPTVLVSLTAPKPCAVHFLKEGRFHYLGGRFISPDIAEKYGLQELVNKYKNDDLIVKL